MGEEISATRLIQIVREEVRKVVKEELADSDKRLQRLLVKIIVEGGAVKEKKEGERQVIVAGGKK